MKLKLSSGLVAAAMMAGIHGVGNAAPQRDGASEVLSLDSVVSEVLTNNPALKAANANWEAMRERIPQARAWADPRLGFDQRLARFVGVPPDSFSDERLMMEQTLPISGRKRFRGDAATAEAASAFEELRRKQLDAVARARAAYFRLANSYKQLELNRKNADLVKQFAEISRAKLAAGDRSQADVLSADTELAKLDEAQFDFQRDISEARTELNVLMNRRPETPLGRPGDLAFQPVDLALSNLEGLALANRPELVVAQRNVEAAQSRLGAARKEWISEPSLRVEADRYNGAAEANSPDVLKSAEDLVAASKERLRLWNITDGQIAGLEQSRKPQEELNLYSPFKGIVEKIGMDQGSKVSAGDRLVDIADLSAVWVWTQFYQDDIAMLKAGLPATITISSYPGENGVGQGHGRGAGRASERSLANRIAQYRFRGQGRRKN
jgi:outer membrane protein TolC